MRRLAHRALVGVLRALAALGPVFGVVPLGYQDGGGQRPAPTRALLAEPPADHPERLLPGVPLTVRERELWAQLEGLGRAQRRL